MKLFPLILIPFLLQDAEPPDPEAIEARVNDEIITRFEVDRHLSKAGLSSEERKSFVRQLARNLLLQQEARRYKIIVTGDDVTAVVDRQMKRLGGEEPFAAWLRFRGLTMSEYRETMRKDILVQHLHYLIRRRGLTGEIDLVLVDEVSPAEVREYYRANEDKFKARSRRAVMRLGLRWTSPQEKTEKLRLARSLLRRIESGYAFNTLARIYTDMGQKNILVNIERDNQLFSKDVTAILFDHLKKGETSDIIEDGNTANLFQVFDVVEQPRLTFKEAQHQIRLQLRSRKQGENKRKILQDLVKRAYYWPEDLFEDVR